MTNSVESYRVWLAFIARLFSLLLFVIPQSPKCLCWNCCMRGNYIFHSSWAIQGSWARCCGGTWETQCDTLCMMRSLRQLPPALGRSYSCSTTQIKGNLEWSPPYCLSGWSQVIPARTRWAQRLIKILRKFVCLGVHVFQPRNNTLKCSSSPSSPFKIIPKRRCTEPYLYAHTA